MRALALLSLGLVSATAGDGTGHQAGARGFVEEMRIVSNDANPATTLTSPSDIITTDRGLLLTAHPNEGLIRVFDSTGKYVRSFGRLGQGPGEFSQGIVFFAVVGDTVVINDFAQRSVILYRTDGVLVRQIRFASASGTPPRAPLLRAYLPGDRVLGTVSHGGGRGNPRDSTVYWIADPNSLLTRVERDTVPLTYAHVGTSSGGRDYSQPFVSRISVIADPGGRRAMLLYPAVGRGTGLGQARLLIINRNGIEANRSVPLEVRRLTARDVDAWIAETIEERKRPRSTGPIGPLGRPPVAAAILSDAEVERQLRATLVRPEYLPSADQAIAGADGSLWIRPYWEKTDWTVLSSAGTVVYRVRVPVGMRVVRVSLDRFWASASDNDGLPIITRNRVAPR